MIVERGLIPFVDIAYQGFGRGLNEDAHGLRGILAACDEVVVAQSCDKNFSVYRDRVGSLFVKTGSREASARRWRMSTSARERCGRCRLTMARPPCISCSTTRSFGRAGMVELAAMRDRINSVRQRIAAADPRLAFIGGQYRDVFDAPVL